MVGQSVKEFLLTVFFAVELRFMLDYSATQKPQILFVATFVHTDYKIVYFLGHCRLVDTHKETLQIKFQNIAIFCIIARAGGKVFLEAFYAIELPLTLPAVERAVGEHLLE
jgi:hypothetical protein